MQRRTARIGLAPLCMLLILGLVLLGCRGANEAVVDRGASERTGSEPLTRQTHAMTTVTPVPPPTDGVAVSEACRNTDETANGTYVRRGWPSDATTGPEITGHDEGFLPPSGVDGKWIIREDNQIIDGVYHNGVIEVRADDVTISNSVICGSGSHIVLNRADGLAITNSIIRGERGAVADTKVGSPCQAAVAYGDYIIRRSELTGCTDSTKAVGAIEITGSWLHDNYTQRRGSGAGTHNDTVQAANGPVTRLVFEGNAAYQDACTSNRHFQLAPTESQPAIDDLRIRGNFFYGINVINLARQYGSVDGLVTDNTFAGSATEGPFGPLLYAGDGMAAVEISGNVYESGQPADSNAGSAYRCTPG